MSEIPVGSVLEYDHGTYRVVDRRHPSEILPGDDSTDYFMEATDSKTMQAGAREWLHETDMGDPEIRDADRADATEGSDGE